MKKMEKTKYLEPKSSESITEIVKFMHVYQQNIVNATKIEPPVQQETVLVQTEEPIAEPEGSQLSKKKNLLWV